MKRLIGRRGLSAAMGLFMFATATSAPAQTAPAFNLRSVQIDQTAKALGRQASNLMAKAVATVSGSVVQSQPASAVTLTLAPSIAREAAWLRNAGWPLYALVDRFSAGSPLDAEANCVAVAVYHEARGETLEGQLAVARVIMNRAASGKYPATWCGTVKQPWQFSFVNPRTGQYPAIDEDSLSWKRALGITRLAINNAVPSLGSDVLWYHADYVAPSWGRRLNRVEKIGAHIFYRA